MLKSRKEERKSTDLYEKKGFQAPRNDSMIESERESKKERRKKVTIELERVPEIDQKGNRMKE